VVRGFTYHDWGEIVMTDRLFAGCLWQHYEQNLLFKINKKMMYCLRHGGCVQGDRLGCDSGAWYLLASLVQVLQKPEVVRQFNSTGAEVAPNSPEAFGAYIKHEIDRWGKVVRNANLQAQ
jgi:hypothetical protein